SVDGCTTTVSIMKVLPPRIAAKFGLSCRVNVSAREWFRCEMSAQTFERDGGASARDLACDEQVIPAVERGSRRTPGGHEHAPF
ncbi:MAG TPA: hypothetical protein VGL45_05275, partial [Bradyrhizobium sp.]